MNISLPIVLTIDDEIVLKPLIDEDADRLFELVDQNRHHLREFLGWLDNNTSKDDSLAFIQEEKEQLKKKKAVTLGIHYKGHLVGLISLDCIDHLNFCANIGYWISKKYQGHGIMSRCTKKVIEYGFNDLKLHRLELRCVPHNPKSQRVAEKLGFTNEGRLKGAIAHYGEFFDAFIYSLINHNHKH